MPTGVENRRLNLEKHPPPRKGVGCMDCVAQWPAGDASGTQVSLPVRQEELPDLCPALVSSSV